MKNKINTTAKSIAEIIPAVKLPRDLTQFFSYRIPEELKEEIKIGDAVTIPFRKKEVLGIVHGFSDEAPEDIKIKDIKNIIKELSFSKKQMELAQFVSKYYYAPLSLVIKTMLPEMAKKESRKKISFYNEYEIREPEENIEDEVLNIVKKEKNILLAHSLGAERHKIYKNIIEKHGLGGQTLLMLPEYFDIWNLAEYYMDALGRDSVAVLCSDITKNQYFEEWQKVKSGAAKLIIGTRQAVFAPFVDLKLVIADNEHNSSYKQWDQNPRYNGINAAVKLAEIHAAKILLASPVPSLESYCRTNKDFFMLDISRKLDASLHIVDLETERKSGNYSFISEKLHDALMEKIYAKKQALVFIPRLGEKTMHQCRDCGYIAQCDTCHNALIGYKGKLYCSRCKELHEPLRSCPHCKGQNVGAFGGGSRRVFEELEEIFKDKNINIAELDSSISQDSKRNQKTLEDFQKGKIDILAGTQMIWKNWNMPNLGIVGIVFPEIIFATPGFQSREHAWQFLHKVHELAQTKTVIIETYKPQHRYFREFVNTDIKKYLQEELKMRSEDISKIPYPPMGKLIKLIYKHTDPRACEKEARWQYEVLQRAAAEMHLESVLEVMPPFSAYSYKEYGKYRWHIILKHHVNLDIETRNRLLGYVKKDWIVDIDPDEIL